MSRRGNRLGTPPFLTSWKEIAEYLGKAVRTVQRWERTLGLPVRRPKPTLRGVVIAIPDELDAWVRGQHTLKSELALPRVSDAGKVKEEGIDKPR